ncbi:RNA polymerase sigma factor [Williamwhitmania taraxaci]|uniref:RNA polymerase sigma-70 factor, ECF subfamily n=1 Tax=Williamwhitmania taraxaci TaxID=1640674 RepID=A0A1G6GZ64_9BACT|nr:RNA polymerase sigma factor [Williamwhitmania taraxaci]SDB87350.1 RNA polymerase sigma-70 factor, ECF subfamily [Williamwhitmania taraxaci]
MTAEEYNYCVNAHSDNVYRFILKSIRDVDKAKDIVQDSYEKLWIKRSEVSYEKSKSYLFSIAYHTMIDQIRRDKRIGSFDEVKPVSFSHSEQYSDLNELLHRAVEQLPEIQKNVLLLRDYEGYSYEEIGEITGLNESQVKVYIYRARVFLKSYIGSLEVVI